MSRWVSETTQKKSLQKYLKSGICWKGNAYYPASLCFRGWSCPSIFFIQTDTDYLVAEFTVLEHLCSTSLYHKILRRTVTLVGSEKMTEVPQNA